MLLLPAGLFSETNDVNTMVKHQLHEHNHARNNES
jgi:hypothetical protein